MSPSDNVLVKTFFVNKFAHLTIQLYICKYINNIERISAWSYKSN